MDEMCLLWTIFVIYQGRPIYTFTIEIKNAWSELFLLDDALEGILYFISPLQ